MRVLKLEQAGGTGRRYGPDTSGAGPSDRCGCRGPAGGRHAAARAEPGLTRGYYDPPAKGWLRASQERDAQSVARDRKKPQVDAPRGERPDRKGRAAPLPARPVFAPRGAPLPHFGEVGTLERKAQPARRYKRCGAEIWRGRTTPHRSGLRSAILLAQSLERVTSRMSLRFAASVNVVDRVALAGPDDVERP